MNFDNDLPIFLADYGIEATALGVTHLVIFNNPDAVILDDQQVSGDATIRYITSEFPNLFDGIAIHIEGEGDYKIRGEPLKLGDGKHSLASLRK